MLTIFTFLSNYSGCINPFLLMYLPLPSGCTNVPSPTCPTQRVYQCTITYLSYPPGVPMYHSILTLLYLPTCPDWCPGTSHKRTVRADRNPSKNMKYINDLLCWIIFNSSQLFSIWLYYKL
jgi:hypothetical protein